MKVDTRLILAGIAGFLLKAVQSSGDTAVEVEDCEADRELWVGRARGAAIRVEELSGSDYDWPEE